MAERSVILLSGGIDSSIMLAEEMQAHECYCLTVDYHQRSEHAEVKAAKRIASVLGTKEHRVLTFDLRSLLESSLTGDRSLTIRTLAELRSFDVSPEYVPARNTIMLSLCLAWAETIGAGRILIGCTAEDRLFPDCKGPFIDAFNELSEAGTTKKPRVIAPFIDLRKHEIIQRAVELGVDWIIPETISCYQAKGMRHCGRCAACQYRQEAFDLAGGIVDTTEYIASL